jgi:hypothetical protein
MYAYDDSTTVLSMNEVVTRFYATLRRSVKCEAYAGQRHARGSIRVQYVIRQ